MPIEVPILEVIAAPLYQQIAIRVRHMVELGMSRAEIARRLGIDWRTVDRALAWIQAGSSDQE